ncbi:MAG: hypothetical protein ABI939_12755, partial [Anaerolineaceae bacterium]
GTLKRTFYPETIARPARPESEDATESVPPVAHPAESSAKVMTVAKVPSWRASSYDLLTGLTVRDVTDTIPGYIFDELLSRICRASRRRAAGAAEEIRVSVSSRLRVDHAVSSPARWLKCPADQPTQRRHHSTSRSRSASSAST